jgi:acetolactate synthase, small subunit
MKRVIALLMENQPGALSRVVGLFSQRGYNIETLIVAPTNDPTLSRLTMTTIGDEKVVQQITKQLDKLIDVVTVCDLGESEFVERELMLVKLNKGSIAIDEIEKIEGKVVFEDNNIINLQCVGEP